MTAKVLCSFYPQESGFKVHRVYLESNFKQGEADLDLMIESNNYKVWVLRKAEVFGVADIEPTPVKPEKYDVELEYDYQDPRTEFEDFDLEDFEADEDTILDAVKRAIRNNHYPRVGEMINGDSKFYEITQIIYYGGPNVGTGIRYHVRYDNETTNP